MTTSLIVWQCLLLLCFLSVHSIDGFLPLGRHTSPICKLRSSSVQDVTKVLQPRLEIPENEVDTVYDHFVLPNDIPVILVSDPSSEKASGSLAVATGAANDPIDRSGLAHFTEHAVFLGSEKYPQEDAYKQYLSKNGGSSNAATGMETTTFKFEVNGQAFDGALDLFSQFFKKPLFTADAIGREVMAVDAEDSKNRILDGRRVLQVTKDCIIDGHPYKKFSTGNVRTIAHGTRQTDTNLYAEEVSEVMREFHQQYYRPQHMALSLVGPQSVEELKQLAHTHFAEIQGLGEASGQGLGSAPAPVQGLGSVPETPTKTDSSSQDICSYPFQQGGVIVRLRPIKEIRDVSILWPLPSTRAMYRANPLRLVGFLLGHKCKGSVFATLQDKGWAMGVSAGTGTEYDDFSVFEASIALTEQGLQHWKEVIEIIYQYLHLIATLSDEEINSVWGEIRATSAIGFRFREKATAYDMAPYLSEGMLKYPTEHVVSRGWLLDEIDVTSFRSLVARLTPDTAVTMVRSREFTWLPDDDDDKEDEDKKEEDKIEEKIDATTTTTTTNNNNSNKENVPYSYHSHTPLPFLGENIPVGQGSNRREPWYGVYYHLETNPTDLHRQWSHARFTGLGLEKGSEQHGDKGWVSLSLPSPNPFISYELATSPIVADSIIHNSDISHNDNTNNDPTSTTSSSLSTCSHRPLRSSPPVPITLSPSLAEQQGLPTGLPKELSTELIQEPQELSSNLKVWLSNDAVFNQPKTIFQLLLHTDKDNDIADGHPANSLITSVHAQLVSTKYYPATLAGLGYSLTVSARGLGLSFAGYSNKLPVLVQQVVSEIGSPSFWSTAMQPSLVALCQERLVRGIKGYWKERPDQQCDALLSYLLQENAWMPGDRLAAAEAITVEMLVGRITQALRNQYKVTAYAHGDMRYDQVTEMMRETIQTMGQAQGSGLGQDTGLASGQGLGPASGPGLVSKDVSARARLLPERSHTVVAIPPFNPDDTNTLLLVLRSLLSQPAFAELRTKKQLGYIVSLSASGYGRYPGNVRGILIRILSNRFTPPEMEHEVSSFLHQQQQHLSTTLTTEDLQHRIASIVQSLLDPPTSYSEEAGEFWDAIMSNTPFNWTQLVIKDLQLLTVDKVLSTANEWLFNPQTRRSLSMMLFGATHEQELATFLAQGQGLEPASASGQGLVSDSASALGLGLVSGKNALSGDGSTSKVVSIEGLKELRDSFSLYNPPSPSTTTSTTTTTDVKIDTDASIQSSR